MGQRLSTPLKEKEWKVVNAAGDVQQILKETSADMVTVADAGNKFTSDNVEGVLQEIATGLENAGKVDDVEDVNGSSIVTNKIAKLTKAAVGLGNVDNTADADKSVKYATNANHAISAGKVDNSIAIGGSNSITYDGSAAVAVLLDNDSFSNTVEDIGGGISTLSVELKDSGVTAGTYNGITVDEKGRVTGAVDGDYATNTELAKKLDKAGGSITGDLTIGGNLNVNGSTTTIDSTTLRVEDKLIEVAKSNTTKLTTPAGIVVPKYDGTNYGALVIDGDGNAQVGDVVLDESGNINVNSSDLQTLATRTGLTDGNLVKWDDTNKTLVPDTTVASNASSALSKANTNATSITNIVNGTTKVGKASTADSATNVTTNINGKAISSIFESDGTTVKDATSSANATNVTTNINGNAISSIFESNGTTVKNATNASNSSTTDKLKHTLTIYGNVQKDFDGSSDLYLSFADNEFTLSLNETNDKVATELKETGVTAGSYTALTVDSKGRATAGGRAFAFIENGAAIPDDVMVGGLIFESVT